MFAIFRLSSQIFVFVTTTEADIDNRSFLVDYLHFDHDRILTLLLRTLNGEPRDSNISIVVCSHGLVGGD